MKISFKWRKQGGSASPASVVIDECLNEEEATKIKQHLDPEKLLLLRTEERISFLVPLIGSKAEWFNTKFENHYVLKNQQAGLSEWANKAEIKENRRRDILGKISRLEKMLTPEEEERFLEELVEISLGIKVTEDEEKTIRELCSKADEARLRTERGGSRQDYERARAAVDAYVEELKSG